MQWGSLLPYMPSYARAPVAAPLQPAGDGDDGAQTWKQLTQAQTCCWSNLITHIMCHYWAGRAAQIQHLLPTQSTQYLPRVYTHLMLLHTSIRTFWNKPFIIIDECQNTVQSYSSHPDASTFNLHHQGPHEAAHRPPASLLCQYWYFSAMHQKSLCQRSDSCPKYYYLSCQCAAAQSLNVIHGIVCPRPVPGSCLLPAPPSLILVTVFNGTPSVMKKWWMFSENYWSDRHNWLLRRDNQIESLVPLTAPVHNSCFSWAIR